MKTWSGRRCSRWPSSLDPSNGGQPMTTRIPTCRRGLTVLTVQRAVALALAASTAVTARGVLAQPPDAIYHNAKVVTVDRRFSIAEAIAVRGDRIVGVGTNEQILALREPDTRVIDLGGKTVLPGL